MNFREKFFKSNVMALSECKEWYQVYHYSHPLLMKVEKLEELNKKSVVLFPIARFL